jgi:hypothetical protein
MTDSTRLVGDELVLDESWTSRGYSSRWTNHHLTFICNSCWAQVRLTRGGCVIEHRGSADCENGDYCFPPQVGRITRDLDRSAYLRLLGELRREHFAHRGMGARRLVSEERLRPMLVTDDVQVELRRQIADRTLDPEMELSLWRIAFGDGVRKLQLKRQDEQGDRWK